MKRRSNVGQLWLAWVVLCIGNALWMLVEGRSIGPAVPFIGGIGIGLAVVSVAGWLKSAGSDDSD